MHHNGQSPTVTPTDANRLQTTTPGATTRLLHRLQVTQVVVQAAVVREEKELEETPLVLVPRSPHRAAKRAKTDGGRGSSQKGKSESKASGSGGKSQKGSQKAKDAPKGKEMSKEEWDARQEELRELRAR